MPITRLALLTLALLLTACGGGDQEDDSKTTPQPPDCSAQPSPCK